VVGSGEWLAQASVFWAVLPAELGLGFLESIVSESAVLGVLLFYRLIYYVLPLLGGGILVSVIELRANRVAARELAAMTAGAVSGIAPRAVAALAFLTGTVLVLGSALPLAEGTRLWLTSFIPLPVFELSTSRPA
jgi:phosphatidylglycerol lysyltransferase